MISLDEVSALCSALSAADDDIAAAEENLKVKKERARFLREESVPTAMQELGIVTLTLTNGQQVSVKQDVFSSITAKNKFAAYEWLEGHGFGGLIKTAVSIIFGKGEMENAEMAVKLLETEGLHPEIGQSVHAQTLGAFLREQMADVETAKDFPLDLFGARPVWIAEISNPKTPKGKSK